MPDHVLAAPAVMARSLLPGGRLTETVEDRGAHQWLWAQQQPMLQCCVHWQATQAGVSGLPAWDKV